MAGPPVLAVVAAGAYLLAALSLRGRRGDRAAMTARGGAGAASGARASPWPARRTAAFLAGLAVLAGALGSELAVRAEGLLSAHVAEHLLLTMVAAPLLVAGAPVALALRALRGAPHARLAEAVRSRAARSVTRPAVAWTLLAMVTIAVHVPIVYDSALRSAPLHALEHVALLTSATLFWLPLVGTNPVRHRLSSLGAVAYLLLAMVPMTLVGVWLASASTVVYQTHATARALGVAPLADQASAGAAMWLAGSLVLVVAIVGLGMRALLREESRALARERYSDAARPASAERAAAAHTAVPGAGR
jgi:putative copper resistance protein D